MRLNSFYYKLVLLLTVATLAAVSRLKKRRLGRGIQAHNKRAEQERETKRAVRHCNFILKLL